MSLSMLRPLNHPRNISAVKAESEPRQRAFHSCQLETKMLPALGHDADGRVVASCWEAVASVQPCMVQHTK